MRRRENSKSWGCGSLWLHPLRLTILLVGCWGKTKPAAKGKPPAAPNPAPTTPSNSAPTTGAEALERMVQAYQQASGYQDQATARLTYVDRGTPTSDEAPLSVAFQRAAARRLVVPGGALRIMIRQCDRPPDYFRQAPLASEV